ncbi:hypothetical protein ONZ45_g3400 [Pleurotus djamor]|nr:hypothetical protein ONZ45_g3400 [Pleurotus djamor]
MPGRLREATPDRPQRVKKEKTRQTRGDSADAPDHSQHDEDDDGEGEVDDEAEGTPHGNKRTRINDDGDSVPSGSQSPPPQRLKVKTQPRDADGFIPGSIVRIQLKNFLTYDYTEFFPGAYLNMILGPNGTGKSSIACAICLGLNFPPSVLGRAQDVNSFVKHNGGEGYVEIELKGSIGKPNIVIRRIIKANSRSSPFIMDGKAATGREVNAKVAELNVQVGNLCSFLPQDRVSEFAQMTPQELLRETQRAAGDENLTSWHETLITKGGELRKMKEDMATEQDKLKTAQERNEGLEREVQRYNERKKIEHEIALLELLLPVQQYRESREKYMEARVVQRRARKKALKLSAKNAPAHKKLKEFEARYTAASAQRDDLKKSSLANFNAMRKKWTQSSKVVEDLEATADALKQLKHEEKERQRKIKKYEADIKGYQDQLAIKNEVEDLEVIRRDAERISSEQPPLRTRFATCEASLRQVVTNKVEHQRGIDSANTRLGQLDDVNTQKFQRFAKFDADHAEAVKWLRANRDKFEQEIFEPPMLTVTIPNAQYTNAVEALFSFNTLKMFVMQNQRDFDTFNRYMHKDKVLGGRDVRINTWFKPGNQPSPPPLSEDELKQLGFDGYALKYVDYPEGMKWFLCESLQLHRSAIGLFKPIDVNKAMEAVTRMGPDGRGGNGATFIVGNIMHQVGRSRYGRRTVTDMTRDIKRAWAFVGASVDQEAKSRAEGELREHQKALVLCEERQKELEDERSGIQADMNELERRMDAVKRRKKAVVDERQRIIQLNGKIDRTTKALEDQLKQPPIEAKRLELKHKIAGFLNTRVNTAREYVELAQRVVVEQNLAAKAGLEFLQIGADKQALQELCNEKDRQHQEALIKFHEATQLFDRLKAESSVLLTNSRALLANIDEELYDEFDAIEKPRRKWEQSLEEAAKNKTTPPPPPEGIETRNAAEFEADLAVQRNNLELNLHANPGVLEQYEKRKAEIAALIASIEEKQKKVERLERNIKHARDNWQPALETLVKSIGLKFSAAFDRIGCAGEIRISEHEDYAKWAIDILVKFRDTEKLQLLTAQRQSGGERSLTTILYLMSLTEEARAPFSLVDEINQGMDQRAERSVHNSMVQVTCKEDSAQYFLITPKLLPDLDYHERMRILCVNNGEWLPDEPDLGNMMGMIDNYVKSRAANVN